MQTHPTLGKISQRKKPKIVVVGDSFAKEIAGELAHSLRSMFEVIGQVKPGSGMKVITELANQEITTLTKKDMVVVWGGANDIARNEANKALTHINSVKSRKHTNVLLVSVPTRFDLITTSCVNKEVITYNRKLHKWMKQYEHVKIIDSELQRKYFTRHGMHMNLAGKELIAQRIMEHIKEHFTKKETSTITLQWKQMDNRTASIREYDPRASTDVTTTYIQEKQTSFLNNNNSKDTNSVIGCSVGKATVPKRDKKCLIEKNEDFLWY